MLLASGAAGCAEDPLKSMVLPSISVQMLGSACSKDLKVQTLEFLPILFRAYAGSSKTKQNKPFTVSFICLFLN